MGLIQITHILFYSFSGMECSHLCLVHEKTQIPYCSCPQGSGLVLSNDGLTCGSPPTCKTDEFTCSSGTTSCIPLQWRCDGQIECSDFSDEISCPVCGDDKFRCRNSECVNATLICDTVPHCTDASDEINCCPKDKFQCTLSHECIDESLTCDGVNDCEDSSDENIPQCANHLPQTIKDGISVGAIVAIIVIIVMAIAFVALGIIIYAKKYVNFIYPFCDMCKSSMCVL